ncbi:MULTISPECIES: hypothetical protein [unclassified Streptomyces]|uniref:hypothetical protein n=1 Tax=unclassified Streptomyces TaxID=2593676 RepID=UPI0033C6E34D
MSKTSVTNQTGSMLCLWVEPWGTDHWMRPGEEFAVVTGTEPEESQFNVVVHDQGITVWVNSASSPDEPDVFDKCGNRAPCGHQRPGDAG